MLEESHKKERILAASLDRPLTRFLSNAYEEVGDQRDVPDGKSQLSPK